MSDILSIRIHDGGDLSEREMIVLPKGAIVYVPGATDRPPCKVTVSISGTLADPEIAGLARRVAEMIRKAKPTPLEGEEMTLG